MCLSYLLACNTLFTTNFSFMKRGTCRHLQSARSGDAKVCVKITASIPRGGQGHYVQKHLKRDFARCGWQVHCW